MRESLFSSAAAEMKKKKEEETDFWTNLSSPSLFRSHTVEK